VTIQCHGWPVFVTVLPALLWPVSAIAGDRTDHARAAGRRTALVFEASASHGSITSSGTVIQYRNGTQRATWRMLSVMDHARTRRGQVGRAISTRWLHGWVRTGDGNLKATQVNRYAAMTVTVRTGPASGLFSVDVERRYRRNVYVLREHLELRMPCRTARLLWRDERMIRARPGISYHVDRWTDRFVEMTFSGRRFALVDAPDLSGMDVFVGRLINRRVAPRRSCRIVLELDDHRNHLAVYAARCKRHWYPPSPRILRDRRFRRRGEVVENHVLFRVGQGPVVVKRRFPRGFDAAVVFTDHADQSAPGPLRALLLGRSDATIEHPVGGFIGNGLHLTKTLFARGGPSPQMDDPGVRALAGRAATKGIEFGPHSATPRRDSRLATEQALKLFSGLGHTWIDHQPDTNCEAYSCRGWRRSSPFFLADLLFKSGFRYVWTGQDVRLRGGRLDMFQPLKWRFRPSILFPFQVSAGGRGVLWLWRSVWYYRTPASLDRGLSQAHLDRLATQHGLFIAHTYLDDHHPPGHRRHRMALVLRRAGIYVLHPAFRLVLARLGAAQRSGRIWVPSLGELADYLVVWNRIFVQPLSRNRFLVRNPSTHAIKGLVVTIGAHVTHVSGPAASSVRILRSGPTSLLELNVPASDSVIVTFDRDV